MTEWLKKWSGICGSIMVIVGFLGAAVAYADSLIDTRVQTKLAGMLQGEMDAMTRKLNGLQEQTNSGISEQRVIKEQLKSIERQQEQRSEAIEKQLELIIRLIEKQQ